MDFKGIFAALLYSNRIIRDHGTSNCLLTPASIWSTLLFVFLFPLFLLVPMRNISINFPDAWLVLRMSGRRAISHEFIVFRKRKKDGMCWSTGIEHGKICLYSSRSNMREGWFDDEGLERQSHHESPSERNSTSERRRKQSVQTGTRIVYPKNLTY